MTAALGLPATRAPCPPSTSGRSPSLPVRAAVCQPPPPARLRRSVAAHARPPSPPPAVARRSPALQSIEEDSPEAVIVRGKLWDWRSWTPRGKGLLMLNALVLLCASNWVIIKEAESTSVADPEVFTALRFAVAAAAFTPWLLRGLRDKETFRAGLDLGFWSAMGYLTQAEGLLSTDASRASFLSTFTVVTVPVLAGLEGEKVSLATYACAASALLGVYFLENGGAPPSWGDLWSLASAIAFAVQLRRTELRTKSLPEGEVGETVLPLLAVIVAVVAVITAAAAVARDPGGAVGLVKSGPAGLGSALAGVDWRPVAYTGIFSTDLILALEIYALKWTTAVDAAVVYATEPVIGAILAWVILGERFGPKGFLGAAIIMVSALTTQLVGVESGGGDGEEKKGEEKR